MRISDYYGRFTDKREFGIRDIVREGVELLGALLAFNQQRISDELGDVSVFAQLWLYCCFGHDAKLWRATRINLRKVQERKPVWERLYKAAGLPMQRSVYCANYLKQKRVVKHLMERGASRERALAAFDKVVLRAR